MPRDLAIFPLPLVLFPGAVQPLHVFEPRYRQLLADSLAGDRCFGITYVTNATGGDPVPIPGDVGCVAEIRTTQALPDGRSNIVTVGGRRFTLNEWLPSDRSYRLARVEEFSDEPAAPEAIAAVVADVRRDFERLTVALASFTDHAPDPHEISDDPEHLSFQIAARLQLEPPVQLELLRLRSTLVRLQRLGTVLAPLAADLERRSAVRLAARRNGRSGLQWDIERTTH